MCDVATCFGHEAASWLFPFKTTLAALLAMWISMRFELGQPVTAIVTVFLLMQPQSGLVLTKSIYRMLGTLAGALACLTLFALFPQQRVLFLLGLSFWVGVCTAGAALLRNFSCYAFVLAGYTAAMIGMATVANPAGFFNYAVARCTEVTVGIICAGLVSDLIFPRSLAPAIIGTVQGCYAGFLKYAHVLLSERAGGGESEARKMHLSFIGHTLSLESLRGSAFWEANTLRRRDACLRRLNADFMAMTTTAHSLHQLMGRLRRSGSRAAPSLTPLLAALDAILPPAGDAPLSAPAIHHRARQIAAFRTGLARRVETLRTASRLAPDHPAALDFDTGAELVRRFTGELHDFTRQYLALHSPPAGAEPRGKVRFSARTDPTMAILNGVRAMLAVLLVALFWIITAWPYGAYAVMMVAIACALFASTPAPATAINLGLLGGCIALPLAFICKFFILPVTDGFVQLSAVLGLFLLLSAWLMGLTRKTMMIGLGFCCMFCFMITPGNTMQYDPIKLINFGWSQVLGQAAAATMFAIFAPVTSPWFKRRLPAMLRRQITLICRAPLDGLAERFESGTRDIMQRIAEAGRPEDAQTRPVIDWMFLVLETGRAVIHLRCAAEGLALIAQKKSVEEVLHAIERLFRQPTAQQRRSVVATVDEALRTFREAAHQEGDRRSAASVLTSLHSLRLTLLDSETALQGELSYAA
jgi:uncharacterized membrane protein YccC